MTLTSTPRLAGRLLPRAEHGRRGDHRYIVITIVPWLYCTMVDHNITMVQYNNVARYHGYIVPMVGSYPTVTPVRGRRKIEHIADRYRGSVFRRPLHWGDSGYCPSVSTTPSWRRGWTNFSHLHVYFYSCIPTGMHEGQT